MMIKNRKEKTVNCAYCGIELSSKDEVYIDNDDIYCSLNCLYGSSCKPGIIVRG